MRSVPVADARDGMQPGLTDGLARRMMAYRLDWLAPMIEEFLDAPVDGAA